MEHKSVQRFTLPRVAIGYRCAVQGVQLASISIIAALVLYFVTLPAFFSTRVLISAGVVVIALCAFEMFVDYRKICSTQCTISDSTVIITKGRLFHVEYRLPRSSVLYSRISTTPLKRVFGLSVVQFHTLQGVVSLDMVAEDTASLLVDIVTSGQAAPSDVKAGNAAN